MALMPRTDLTDRTSDSRQIEALLAEARYARQRYDLYKAKMYGLRPTTLTRLRELERMHEGADARLRRAQEERPQTAEAGQPPLP
jgi:hypothetical protein